MSFFQRLGSLFGYKPKPKKPKPPLWGIYLGKTLVVVADSPEQAKAQFMLATGNRSCPRPVRIDEGER